MERWVGWVGEQGIGGELVLEELRVGLSMFLTQQQRAKVWVQREPRTKGRCWRWAFPTF